MAIGNFSGRARAWRQSPTAQAVCDRCGIRYQLDALSSQMQWAGPVLIDTGFLVCKRCLDVPNEQFRTIILPPDPVPRVNPRPDVQATPIYLSGGIVPTVPGNQNFNQYVLGAAISGMYPTGKPEVLAAVAAVSGVPTPSGVADRSIVTEANQTVEVMAPSARTYLLIYNPTQVQIAFSTGAATWGASTNLLVGPGEAWFSAAEQGQGGPWQGGITAVSPLGGLPLYAWEWWDGMPAYVAPVLSISSDQVSFSEGNSGAVTFGFTVTRTGDLSGISSAAWDVSSATANGLDFVGSVFPSGVVEFAAGETTKAISISVAGDASIEPDETFTVTLSAPVGATIGTASASATILNDDVSPSVLSISADQATRAEGNTGSTAFTFTVTRSGGTAGAASADYAVTSASATGADFVGGTLPTGTVSFADGETTKTITVNVAGDTTVESDEAFTVTLSNPAGATLGTATATSTIVNDDTALPVLSISAGQASSPEGNSGGTTFVFIVSRTGSTAGSCSVSWAVSGAAVTGADFVGGSLPFGTVNFAAGEASKVITINVAGDTTVEPDEDFTVTLSSPVNATVGTASATTTILNDDVALPVVSISANQSSVAEGNSGTTAFGFTVTRTGSTAGSSSVAYSVTGAATASDFAGGVLPSGTVNFAAGETVKTITINVSGDTTIESDEAFTVTLSSPTGATIGTASANSTILNDDTVLSIAADQASLAEGNSGTTAFTFTVTRSGSTSGPSSASWAVTSASATGSDFVGGTLPTGTVSFVAGETTKTITVNVAGDTSVESDETFTVTLSSPVGATLGTLSSSSIILNDDAALPVLSITADQISAFEGNSGTTPFTFTVTRTGSTAGSSSANWAVSVGTATTSDFVGGVLPSGSVSFAAGETTKTITVNVIADTTVETDETFTVTLSSPSGATLGTAAASATILNDDSSGGSGLGTMQITNPTGSTVTGEYQMFGYAFPRAAVPNGQGPVGLQMDVTRRWDDNSVRIAHFTTQVASLAAGATANYDMGSLAAVGSPTPVTIVPASVNVVVEIVLSGGGGTITKSFSDLYTATITRGDLTYWRQGPVATECRAWDRVYNSLRVIMDAVVYANGSYKVEVMVKNDVANEAYGVPVTSTTRILVGGIERFNTGLLTVRQYQGWHKTMYSSGVAPKLHVKHDVAALKAANVVMPFNANNPSVLEAARIAEMALPTWRAPLAGNSVYQSMPDTGGRIDIGPTTAPNALWIRWMSPETKEYALGQCEASLAIPWNVVDSAGKPLMLGINVSGSFWIDGRGTPTLTQQPDYAGTGWATDSSHQPNLAYHAALFTGERWCLDQLQIQAAFSIVEGWPDPRGYDQGYVLGWFAPVRAKAWCLREVAQAALLSPDGTTEGTYFRQIMVNNMNYVLSQIPSWIPWQGQPNGWFIGDYGTPGVIAPWQQDYLYSTLTMCIRMGYSGARAIRDWADNWQIGRHLNLTPEKANVYNMPIQPGGTPVTTWAALSSLMDTPTWSWTLGQRYPGISYMSLCLTDNVNAPTALITIQNAFGDTGTISTEMNSAALDSQIHFDFRPPLMA